MVVKFDDGKVRLWQGVGKKLQFPNIGIRFHKHIDKKDVEEIYNKVNKILCTKYGKGIE